MAASKSQRARTTRATIETSVWRKRNVPAQIHTAGPVAVRAQAWVQSSDEESILEAFSIDLDADLDC
jgi:hypothetical protein